MSVTPRAAGPAEHLARGLAHDLANLAGTLINSATLLALDLPPGSESAEDVRAVRETGERLARLGEVLRDIAGRRAAAPVDLDVGDHLRRHGAALRELGAATIDARAAGQVVRIDPDHLQEVLVELVRNASAACAGAGTITVTSGPGPSIEVRDDGCGMPAGFAATATLPFVAAEGRRVGHGLGLTRAQALLGDAGSLSFAPAPGGGTIATVQFGSTV